MRTTFFLFAINGHMKIETSESDFESNDSKARTVTDYFNRELLLELKWSVVYSLIFK